MTNSNAVLKEWKSSFYYWLDLLGDALGLLKVKEWWSEWRFKKKLTPPQPIERYDSLGWAGYVEGEVPETITVEVLENVVEEIPAAVVEEVQQEVVTAEEEPEVPLMIEPIKGWPFAPIPLPWNKVKHLTPQKKVVATEKQEVPQEPLPTDLFLPATIVPEVVANLESQEASVVLH